MRRSDRVAIWWQIDAPSASGNLRGAVVEVAPTNPDAIGDLIGSKKVFGLGLASVDPK